jgi:hypothetical protein
LLCYLSGLLRFRLQLFSGLFGLLDKLAQTKAAEASAGLFALREHFW